MQILKRPSLPHETHNRKNCTARVSFLQLAVFSPPPPPSPKMYLKAHQLLRFSSEKEAAHNIVFPRTSQVVDVTDICTERAPMQLLRKVYCTLLCTFRALCAVTFKHMTRTRLCARRRPCPRAPRPTRVNEDGRETFHKSNKPFFSRLQQWRSSTTRV